MNARLVPYTASGTLAVTILAWCLGFALMYVFFFRHPFVNVTLDQYSPGFTMPLALGICGFFVIGDVIVYQRVTFWSVVIASVIIIFLMLILASFLYVSVAYT